MTNCMFDGKDHQYEFVSCMNGEETYRCVKCEEIAVDYVDNCSGG